MNTALVYGITDNAIVISARNRDIRLHIGNALSEAFGDIGDAGGHPNMAAATLPLHYFGKVENKIPPPGDRDRTGLKEVPESRRA